MDHPVCKRWALRKDLWSKNENIYKIVCRSLYPDNESFPHTEAIWNASWNRTASFVYEQSEQTPVLAKAGPVTWKQACNLPTQMLVECAGADHKGTDFTTQADL